MGKILVVLGGLLLALGGVVVVVVLFFTFAGISQESGYFGYAALSRTTAAADSEAEMQEESLAAAEAPAAQVAQPRVASSAPKAAAPLPNASFASDARVIRNGILTLVVQDPAVAVHDIEQIIAGIPGAFVASGAVRQAGDPQPSSLTLRVPVEAFDQAMAALRALAEEVLAEQTTARDVTEEYTDVDARLRNLQAAETQLLTLLERADTVEDLLKIENRLAEVRQEIEQLQGRLNVLINRIALATIHVLLHAPPDLSVVVAAESLPSAHTVTAFAVSYRNDGSVSARDARLKLYVPERLSVLDMSQGGVYDPISREISWALSDIPAGAADTVYVHLRVESAEADIQLSAEIQSASAEADIANNAAGITLSFAPDLALEVDSRAAAAQGSEVPVWILYSNVGTADATDVTLQAALPTEVTFVRADFGGSYDRETGAVVWKLGRLQAGETRQVRMDVRVDVAEGRLQIPVAVSAEQADAVAFNDRTDVFLTALREDVSARSLWQPGRTVAASIAALIVVAQGAVNVLIWVLTFGIPLAVIGLLALGVRAGVRRLRRSEDP